MTRSFRPCALVPTYNNPLTVRSVVEGIRAHGLDVVLIDDCSGPEGRAACEQIAADGLANVRHLERNRGKGGAVKHGFAVAHELGFSHAFQVDADGQHDLARIPEFLSAGRERPEAAVLGYPEYDDGVPEMRRLGRRVTTFWVALEVGSRSAVRDAMIGFRLYPLEAVMAISCYGDRMDFDVEVVVRLVRRGTPTVNLPVRVRYPDSEVGGVSHFHLVRDNLRLSLLHARLCTSGCVGWLWRRLRGVVAPPRRNPA
ncbi:MAG: glycosyltransferase family 2 protein [Planctomycetota bacterium]|nr:glycosyltransferase family 2 protein [Planctomycetota bacterium]